MIFKHSDVNTLGYTPFWVDFFFFGRGSGLSRQKRRKVMRGLYPTWYNYSNWNDAMRLLRSEKERWMCLSVHCAVLCSSAVGITWLKVVIHTREVKSRA